MEEAEKLCDQLAIIDHGKIIASGTLPELRAMLGERDVLRLTGRFDKNTVAASLSDLGEIEVVQIEEDGLTLAVKGASTRLSDIFHALSTTGAEVRDPREGGNR